MGKKSPTIVQFAVALDGDGFGPYRDVGAVVGERNWIDDALTELEIRREYDAERIRLAVDEAIVSSS